MYRRLLELLKMVKPRQPHLPQTNVIRAVCKHETILGGDDYFYCADCGAGKL